ncbi:MAG: hypothetical protein HYX74_02425 [Acidobacteria bacterium]|nr:hypothetical protein [Acidobacteriota bacterium]
MAPRVVIAGSLAQRHRAGGHTWVFLQYLLGFRRLGWDVLFLDRLEPEMSVDSDGRSCPPEQSANLRYFLNVMDRFNLRGSFALLCHGGRQCIGLARDEVLDRVRNSAFLLNVMGFLTDEEVLGCAPRRVFLDIDPGFGQMWRELGLADLFAGHDTCVTIGENIGRPGCTIPTCRLQWIATPQPVVLDHWKPYPAVGDRWFTSVATWRGTYGPIHYSGKTYGLRVHEFRKFVLVPRLSGLPFQMALDIDPAEVGDLALLAGNGWELQDPGSVAGDPWAYRSYIRDSRAEFAVAKNLYVETQSGWLSDRSICYLASGKPVLVQDTGIQGSYPTGEGLLLFSTLEEALAGVDDIAHDYARHARAARALAEEYFDSDKVLSRLVHKLGAV